MIGRMKNGASPWEDDPSPAPELNRFGHFVGIQHDDHLRPKPFEVTKLDDLRDDVAGRAMSAHQMRSCRFSSAFSRSFGETCKLL